MNLDRVIGSLFLFLFGLVYKPVWACIHMDAAVGDAFVGRSKLLEKANLKLSCPKPSRKPDFNQRESQADLIQASGSYPQCCRSLPSC